MQRLTDSEVALLLRAFPHFSPLFAELDANVDGVIVVVGFTMGPSQKLSIEEAAAFLSRHPNGNPNPGIPGAEQR
jgi:hypothetical protein